MTKESGEVLVALLDLWSINMYMETAGASTIDILKVLTSLGYGPRKIADLVEKLHGNLKLKLKRKTMLW